MKAASDCTTGATVTAGRGAVVVVVVVGATERGATLTPGAAELDEVGAGTVVGTVAGTDVVVVTSAEDTADDTRLESEETLADSDALLADDP